jgi:hypothetical protein
MWDDFMSWWRGDGTNDVDYNITVDITRQCQQTADAQHD